VCIDRTGGSMVQLQILIKSQLKLSTFNLSISGRKNSVDPQEGSRTMSSDGYISPEQQLNEELDRDVWMGIGIASGILFLICTACVCYAEFCRNSKRKYETVEMMQRRQQHIDRGDHDNWDV